MGRYKGKQKDLKQSWDFSCIPEVFVLVFFVSVIVYIIS